MCKQCCTRKTVLHKKRWHRSEITPKAMICASLLLCSAGPFWWVTQCLIFPVACQMPVIGCDQCTILRCFDAPQHHARHNPFTSNLSFRKFIHVHKDWNCRRTRCLSNQHVKSFSMWSDSRKNQSLNGLQLLRWSSDGWCSSSMFHNFVVVWMLWLAGHHAVLAWGGTESISTLVCAGTSHRDWSKSNWGWSPGTPLKPRLLKAVCSEFSSLKLSQKDQCGFWMWCWCLQELGETHCAGVLEDKCLCHC